MIANHFEHSIGGAAVQGIGAKTDHAMLPKHSIDFGFISHKVRPGFFLQPRHISGDPKPLVTKIQSPLFPFDPLSEYSVRIKVSAPQVPVVAIPDLNLPYIQMTAQIRR